MRLSPAILRILFPLLACITPTPGWKFVHYYPMPPMCGY